MFGGMFMKMLKRIISVIVILILAASLCACGSSPESSSKKSEKKNEKKSDSSSKKEKNDDKDSDDLPDGLTGLFDKLKEGKEENAGSGKDGGKKGSSDTDFRVYCHVATYEAGELVWQVYEDDIDFNNGVAVSFDYDKDTVQYNWTFIDQNAYSNLSASSPSGRASITVYSAGGQDDRGMANINYSDDIITLDWDYGAQDVFVAFGDHGGLVKPIEEVVAGYDNYSSGSGSSGSSSGSDPGDDYGKETGAKTDESIDLSGLSASHGKAYVYRHTQNGYCYEGSWEYSDTEGYVRDGDIKMERTLTVYRFSNHTDIEYMLSSKGEWGEFWHVEYNFPAKCIFFDYIEGGTVTISGNQAIWEDDSGQYREIYTLKSTREFDN